MKRAFVFVLLICSFVAGRCDNNHIAKGAGTTPMSLYHHPVLLNLYQLEFVREDLNCMLDSFVSTLPKGIKYDKFKMEVSKEKIILAKASDYSVRYEFPNIEISPYKGYLEAGGHKILLWIVKGSEHMMRLAKPVKSTVFKPFVDIYNFGEGEDWIYVFEEINGEYKLKSSDE